MWVENPLGLSGDRGPGLVFSDIPASELWLWRDAGPRRVRVPSGQANGNSVDRGGRLLTCEHETRRVSVTGGDGVIAALATHFGGRRLNSPNDVVPVDRATCVFTDPPYGVPNRERELDFQGVYRVEADEMTVTLLVDDFEKPNGLCFSPDGSELYVADTERGHVRRFTYGTTLNGGEVYCSAERPDGLRCDGDGNLWIAAMRGVEVFAPGGRRVLQLALPERPANLAFGGDCRDQLFICARTSLYRVGTAVSA